MFGFEIDITSEKIGFAYSEIEGYLKNGVESKKFRLEMQKCEICWTLSIQADDIWTVVKDFRGYTTGDYRDRRMINALIKEIPSLF